MWVFLSLGSVHSFSNGRPGYSHPNQHHQSGHEREEERGDVCLSTIDFMDCEICWWWLSVAFLYTVEEDLYLPVTYFETLAGGTFTDR